MIKSYFPEPTKSYVVVNERWKNEATAIFGDLGVQVVTGHRFLDGLLEAIVSRRSTYVLSKVHKWVGHVNVLAEAPSTRLNLFMLPLQSLYSTNGLFCYVLFLSVALYFRNLRCHSFLVCCQHTCLWSNNVCLHFHCSWAVWGCVILRMSLASDLYNSSVNCTEHLVRSLS